MIWLSPEILNWCYLGSAFSFDDDASWRRSYEIWQHSEELLSRGGSEFTRIDAITTLHRAIDHRIRLLALACSLKKLPLVERSKDSLEILGYLGIVRPLMLKRINDIRNIVEHEDGKPPSYEECLVFLEFVWYFLRSTDLLTQQPPDYFEFQSQDDDAYGLWIRVSRNDAIEFQVNGWVPERLFSPDAVKGWLSLVPTKLSTRAEYLGNTPDVNVEKDGRGRYPQDILFAGAVRGPAEALLWLTRAYLRVS
jgi:hypothetical protein